MFVLAKLDMPVFPIEAFFREGQPHLLRTNGTVGMIKF